MSLSFKQKWSESLDVKGCLQARRQTERNWRADVTNVQPEIV